MKILNSYKIIIYKICLTCLCRTEYNDIRLRFVTASISKNSVVRRVNSLKFEEVLLCLRSKQRNTLNGKKSKGPKTELSEFQIADKIGFVAIFGRLPKEKRRAL